MEILALQILREIRECGVSAIYGDELNRVWPNNDVNIKQEIEQFAMERGWRLRHYKQGSMAIFDKEPGLG
jgi:hypothetical protein